MAWRLALLAAAAFWVAGANSWAKTPIALGEDPSAASALAETRGQAGESSQLALAEIAPPASGGLGAESAPAFSSDATLNAASAPNQSELKAAPEVFIDDATPDDAPSIWPGHTPLPPGATSKSFLELATDPQTKGKYSVLVADDAESARLWREELRRRAEGTPYANLTLSDLVGLALQNNYELQNSDRDLARSRSEYREAKAKFIPTLDLLADASYSDSMAAADRINRRGTETFNAEAGAEINQELPTGGRVGMSSSLSRTRRETELIGGPDSHLGTYSGDLAMTFRQPLMRGAGFEIALETIRRENLSRMSSEISDYMQRRDVALNVISQFFGIAVTLSNIDVSQTALEVKRKFIRDAETLYEAGTAIPNEIAKAEVQYLNEELRLVNQKQNLENQIESLLEVLGLPLDTPISFAFDLEKLVDSRVAAIPDRESAVQEALAKRPELLITDINVRSSEIALNSARNATLPNLDLQASYADTETQPHFGDLNMDEHRVWTAGVSLAVPLPNIRLKEAAKRAELSLETAKTNRIIRQRQIVQEVDRQLRQLSASEQSIELLRRTVEQAEFNFKQESELFVYGERTSNQVRDAQDDYFAAKEEFNRQIINYQSAIAQIYKALGRSLF